MLSYNRGGIVYRLYLAGSARRYVGRIIPKSPDRGLYCVFLILDPISQSTCFRFHVSAPIRTTVTVESLRYSSRIFLRIVSVAMVGTNVANLYRFGNHNFVMFRKNILKIVSILLIGNRMMITYKYLVTW